MKRKLSSPESSTLLYYLAKLTGLAPFTMNNNRFYPPTLLGKLYPCILGVSYLVFLSVTLYLEPRVRFRKNYERVIMIWNDILQFASLTSVSSSLILPILMHEEIVYLMNKMCNVSKELKSLGIVEKQENLLKNIFVTTMIADIAIVAAFLILTVYEPGWNTLTLIGYYIGNWINLNTLLIFGQMLICIKKRFTGLNKTLHELLIPASHFGPPKPSRIFIVNEPEREGLTDFQRIRKIKALHLALRDLVNRTTHIFATSILTNSCRFSIEFMVASYWMYGNLRNPNQLKNINILCTIFRISIQISAFILVAYASSTTCEQGNATKDVLAKVSMELKPKKLMNELSMFSHQLMHTPVTVSAFGFVSPGYSFIFKIFGTVATYLIIMIQLGRSPARV